MDYLVKREHIGDRVYKPGDTRRAEPAEVAHLVANGVLEGTAKAKADAAPKNKAVKAPKNKAS